MTDIPVFRPPSSLGPLPQTAWPPQPPPSPAAAAPAPLPWEGQPGLDAWWTSARRILIAPREAFAGVPVRGGLGRSFGFWLIGVLVGTGVVHLLLTMQGAARHGFDATWRVLAYCYGSAAPCGLLPMVGTTIGVVWAVVVAIPGLAQLHETTTGKTALAVLVPVLACCGATAVLLVMAVGVALGSLR
jgi:hypothetical protein